jgi:tyrosine decarboxylase / aspartate 1-decarboxylase
VLMKPEHLLWLDHLWQRIDAASVESLRSITR